MSNPWAQSFEELRSPYLQEKKAKKDYDGDGKIESGTDEYMGSKDKAIKKAMAMRGKKKVAEHHQKDADGNVIPHEEEAVVQEDLSKIKDTAMTKGKDLVTSYKKFYSKTPAGKIFNKVKDAAPLAVGIAKKLGTGTTGDGYIGHKSLGIKNPLVKKEHHQKDADGNTIPHEDEGDGTPSSVEEMAKKFGPGGDPIKKKGFIDKALIKLKNNTPVKKVDKAHYEPEGEVIEAKVDTVDPKNKRKRRNERQFGKQTKPYDPDTKEMKTSMGKFMNSMRHDMHDKKRGVKTKGMKKEEIVLESDKKGSGSGTKDACYHKVKSRYSVWPSAYASGALVKCRKAGAKNWGNSSKKEEFDYYQMPMKPFGDIVGECWKTHKQVGTKMKGGKVVPNCVPKNEEFVGEEGINKDPAFDIMRPGGANSPFNADGTPKRKSLNKVRGTAFKKEEIKITPHDISGGTKAGKDFMSGVKNPKTGKPAYKLSNPGGMKIKLAHYDWKSDLDYVQEALKGKKLEVKETGVKNKIEINPEIKTEAAKAPVKK